MAPTSDEITAQFDMVAKTFESFRDLAKEFAALGEMMKQVAKGLRDSSEEFRAGVPDDSSDELSPGPDLEAASTVVVNTAEIENTSIDRLSLLPDALLRNIVSRLPLKDAARTAVLSCRWRPLCAAPSKLLVRSDPRREVCDMDERFRRCVLLLDPDRCGVLDPWRFHEVRVSDRAAINAFDQADPDHLQHVRFVPAKCALRAVPTGGYDCSLDDDPESGVTNLDAPLGQDVGRGRQALAAAAALRTDAVGAAGGGLLAWEMAAGSVQVKCSTVCPAGHTSFANVSIVALLEVEMLQRCVGHHCLDLHLARADAVPEAMHQFLVDSLRKPTPGPRSRGGSGRVRLRRCRCGDGAHRPRVWPGRARLRQHRRGDGVLRPRVPRSTAAAGSSKPDSSRNANKVFDAMLSQPLFIFRFSSLTARDATTTYILTSNSAYESGSVLSHSAGDVHMTHKMHESISSKQSVLLWFLPPLKDNLSINDDCVFDRGKIQKGKTIFNSIFWWEANSQSVHKEVQLYWHEHLSSREHSAAKAICLFSQPRQSFRSNQFEVWFAPVVQALGGCQKNIQFRVSWLQPDWKWSFSCSDYDWYSVLSSSLSFAIQLHILVCSACVQSTCIALVRFLPKSPRTTVSWTNDGDSLCKQVSARPIQRSAEIQWNFVPVYQLPPCPIGCREQWSSHMQFEVLEFGIRIAFCTERWQKSQLKVLLSQPDWTWSVGWYDKDWQFILRFRRYCKSYAVQLLIPVSPLDIVHSLVGVRSIWLPLMGCDHCLCTVSLSASRSVPKDSMCWHMLDNSKFMKSTKKTAVRRRKAKMKLLEIAIGWDLMSSSFCVSLILGLQFSPWPFSDDCHFRLSFSLFCTQLQFGRLFGCYHWIQCYAQLFYSVLPWPPYQSVRLSTIKSSILFYNLMIEDP